jgi:type IV secretion system protein VirB6
MDVCPAVPPGAGFISSMTGYIDCQSQMLGSGAWQAVAAPGSTLIIVLTGFLTILIGLIGYNLLLGRSITVRSGTLAFVKIGAVFALATSWPAYRTLIYDVAIDGPPQLVSEIGPRSGVLGSDGTLMQRLDGVDTAMAQLAVLGAGPLPADLRDSNGAYVSPPPFAGFNVFAFGGSRILFELTSVGAFAIVRIVTGLMLAFGPFFIAFLMFDSTRSLFEGWIRVLAGAALAGVGISIALGLELALVEPWLGNVLARRIAGEALPAVSTELFVITCLFFIIIAAALYACARVTGAFRLAPLVRSIPIVSEQSRDVATKPADTFLARETERAERSRAAALASVLAATGRRDRSELGLSMTSAPAAPRRALDLPASNDTWHMPVPVGRSFTRRPHSRLSAGAARRDSGA